jgi:hypothetical protein
LVKSLSRPERDCREMFCPDPNMSWRKCFKRGALKHHPDRGGNAETFKKLNNCNDLFK